MRKIKLEDIRKKLSKDAPKIAKNLPSKTKAREKYRRLKNKRFDRKELAKFKKLFPKQVRHIFRKTRGYVNSKQITTVLIELGFLDSLKVLRRFAVVGLNTMVSRYIGNVPTAVSSSERGKGRKNLKKPEDLGEQIDGLISRRIGNVTAEINNLIKKAKYKIKETGDPKGRWREHLNKLKKMKKVAEKNEKKVKVIAEN